MISDEVPKTDITSRRMLGTHIKDFAGNDGQRFHGKHANARGLKPFWRMSMSVNDEIENLSMLPVLEGSVLDKVMVFKTGRPNCLPTCDRERDPFRLEIKSQLPAFIASLLDHQIPENLEGGRFGITNYINLEISGALEEISHETQLYDLMEAVLFTKLDKETDKSGLANP
jgi:hypothetical protein